MDISGSGFWIALLQIIGVNIVLSGDNAVVLALAARGLPQKQQKRAIAWGSGAAVVMRIVLTIIAVEALRLPGLKLVGAALLFWIAVKLLLPEDHDEAAGPSSQGIGAAIRTILLADLVMSLDNVLAVAAAAKGSTVLLVIGLAISIPIVVFASQLLLQLMDRFPVIITIGAGLLGWVAGEMLATEPLLSGWFGAHATLAHALPIVGAVAVVGIGKLVMRNRVIEHAAQHPVVAPADGAVGSVMVAVDGSPGAAQALQAALRLRKQFVGGDQMALHLVNVQRSVPHMAAKMLDAQALQSYHKEGADKALAPAQQSLRDAGLTWTEHRLVGEPGAEIAALAATLGCGLIVMGSRGLGTNTGAMLGSATASTLQHARVPVVVVS